MLNPFKTPYTDVTPKQLAATRDKYRVIDVREPGEWNDELGHIEGAELVPGRTLQAAAAEWDRGEKLVVVCRSGGRSASAALRLAQLGFTDVHNLRGGMMAWNQRGLPVAA